MKHWQDTYRNGLQSNNVKFPEQFVVKFFYSETMRAFCSCREVKLLDIGAGFGRNVPLFKEFTSDITCIDPADEAVSQLKLIEGIQVKKFEPPQIDLGKKFDIIVACNSIYYLNRSTNFQDYFQAVVKLLSPEGLFICSFIGEKHSILDGSKKCRHEVFEIDNKETKFIDRRGQLIFVPEEGHNFHKYGLDILSSGTICDQFDHSTRHLKVFCFKNNISIRKVQV
jgi:SAM-dependent methyltransferase